MISRASVLMGTAILISAGVMPAAAQAPAVPSVSTTEVYGEAFFKGVNLNNAEDMLRRVPGAAAVLDAAAVRVNTNRGLGAGAEQILIDGRRLASKSTSASATLRRIAATSVERVELIRGGSDQVQSEGLIINVVLKRDANAKGVGNFEVGYRFTDQGQSEFDGLVSYAGSWRGISYVLGYERSAWSPLGATPSQGSANDWTTRFRDERYYYPSGIVQELRPQKWQRVHQKDTLTFNVTSPLGVGSSDTLRVQLLYQTNPIKQVDTTAQTRFSNVGVQTTRATERHYNKNTKNTLELGAELEVALGPGQFSAIGLHSRNAVDFLDFRERTESTGAYVQLARSVNEQATGEDVLRLSYQIPLSSNQSVTFGAEGARNFLDQEIGVFFDLDRDGRLESIPIPTAEAKVSELRGEFSLKHSWTLNAKWTLESTVATEISRIETNYPAIPIRTLSFVKPRLDLSYSPTARDRFRFKAEKTVGQLDFANFVPAYNVPDSRIDLGNPELAAAETWNFEVAYERRLPKDNGVLGTRIAYRDIWGGPGFVPFGVDANGLPRSRRGNNGTMLGYTLEQTAAIRIPWLPGAQVNAKALFSPTAVRDQFTLLRRRAGPIHKNEFTLGFRHDVPGRDVSYGMEFFDTGGALRVSDVRTSEMLTRDDRFNIFFERKLGASFSLRLDAYNINAPHEVRSRRLFTVSQMDGRLLRSETFDEVRDRRFVLRLRGRF
jgi:hypothetical protein